MKTYEGKINTIFNLDEEDLINLIFKVNSGIFKTLEIVNKENPFQIKLEFTSKYNFTSNLYVMLNIEKNIFNNQLEIFNLTNCNDKKENIQFKKLNVFINKTNNITEIKVDVDLNDSIYPKVLINSIERIMILVFKRSIDFLNNIYQTDKETSSNRNNSFSECLN